ISALSFQPEAMEPSSALALRTRAVAPLLMSDMIRARILVVPVGAGRDWTATSRVQSVSCDCTISGLECCRRSLPLQYSMSALIEPDVRPSSLTSRLSALRSPGDAGKKAPLEITVAPVDVIAHPVPSASAKRVHPPSVHPPVPVASVEFGRRLGLNWARASSAVERVARAP